MYKNKFNIEGNRQSGNIAGEQVKVLRKSRGWSQNDLAVELQKVGHDVGKNAIQEMEAGKRFVTDIELKALTLVFNVSADSLLQSALYRDNKRVYFVAE